MNPKNPDGKEPYTLEWLELIGFKNDDQCTAGVSYHWINAGRKSIFDLQYHHLDEDGELPENGEGWVIANENGELEIDDPKTRDGVRELCEVLNIPLKEPALTKVAV